MSKVRRKDALDYHVQGRPGKIQVVATKPLTSQRDLSLAYSPGVAEPCLAIAEDPSQVYAYTARGNLVAVISNGTAVLGLGNIGPLAAKPVMEGKGVLFKKFADIDVFDLELDASDPDRFVDCVAALEPTFGGINLEDIKAPESFYIEEKLRARMKIPVFHDDQHGTAIISGAALINAALLQDKPLASLKVVVSGAGASAIACSRFFVSLGVTHKNILMADSSGIIHTGRTDLSSVKREFAAETNARTLADALHGADVFLGLSKGGLVTPEMVKTMAARPIIFALANPDPEIGYEEAKLARPDAIVATGRSDYDNQVNNVLGFPFVFRGALDVRATSISEEMKIAAAQALAELARRDVPQEVSLVYGAEFHFGPSYIIPKPFDPRVLYWVAPAVARAAVASGVAKGPFDEEAYTEHLRGLLGNSSAVLRKFVRRAATDPRRVVFPEAEDPRILQACQILIDEGVAKPVLLGPPKLIQEIVQTREIDIDLSRCEIVDPNTDPALSEYATRFYEQRQRKGMGRRSALKLMRDRNHFGLMMLGASRRCGGHRSARAVLGDDPPRAADHRPRAGRASLRRHVPHAASPARHPLLRGHHREHAVRRRGARRHRRAVCRRGAHVRARATHRDGEHVELRLGAASRCGEGCTRGGDPPRTSSRSRGRRRDAGQPRGRLRDAEVHVPVLAHDRCCQRARVPQPRCRQRRVQVGARARRCHVGGAGVARHGTAGHGARARL
jgi:malate dehydrogenase (oxaloacetate-decarboxylating)(NADP+)